MSSAITFGLARTEKELMQILELQSANLSANLSEERRMSHGFLTVHHSIESLTSMNASAPQVIAKEKDKVIGYALAMRPELKYLIPLIAPMFEMVEALFYKGVPLKKTKYYVMGQICVDEKSRGVGVFDGLYSKHREAYSKEYDYCVTEVSTRNLRSMKAHRRVGFKTIHTFRDDADEWNIVIWDWQDKLNARLD